MADVGDVAIQGSQVEANFDRITEAPLLAAIASEFLTEPFPAWTAVGVTELIDPEVVVEVSCVAVKRG